MPRPEESWIPPRDPVQALIDITASGLYSRIRYRSGSRDTETVRVIEPRQLVEAASGLTVRAMQIEPDRGVRSFAVYGVTWVEPDDRRIPEPDLARNTFARGQAVRVQLQPIRAASAEEPAPRPPSPMPAAAIAPPASAWGQQWFTQYVGAIRDALVDLSVPADEEAAVRAVQARLGLTKDQIRAAHCFVLAEELLALSIDGLIDDREEQRLTQMVSCLRVLGWPMQY